MPYNIVSPGDLRDAARRLDWARMHRRASNGHCEEDVRLVGVCASLGAIAVLLPTASLGAVHHLDLQQFWMLAFRCLNTLISFGAFAELLAHCPNHASDERRRFRFRML